MNELPILESLSEATNQALEPIELLRDDYLEIWMHENGEDFMMKAIQMHPAQPKQDNGFLPRAEIAACRKEATLTSEGGVRLTRSGSLVGWQARKFLYRLVERTHLGAKNPAREGEFRVAATDFNALIVHHSWLRDKLVFRSDESRTLFYYLIRRFLVQTMRAKMQAQFKIDGVVPELPEQFVDHDENPLADYQKAALAFSLRSDGTALFMEQGTGKTAVAIARVCTEARMHRSGKLGDEARMMRVLIVCPKQVRLNWQSEFEKFATVAGKVTIIRGGKLKRTQLLTHAIRQEEDCAFTAMVVNYETATNDIETISLIPWDLVILDESHYIKSARSKRGKTIVNDLRDVADRRMELTGTPIANTIFDFFAQAEFLGQGLSGFKTIQTFKAFHGKFENRGHRGGYEKLLGYDNVPLFQERLARVSFRITKKEAGLQLPDKVRDIIEVDMTPLQNEIYAKVAESIAVEIESGRGKGEMTVEHILTRLLRLAQITSGFVRFDSVKDPDTGMILKDGYSQPIRGNNPKLDAMIELIKADFAEDPNKKIVIWACFVQDLVAIGARLDKEGIRHGLYYGATSDADREKFVTDFNNDPDFKVLVGNPATMAEGLNLLGYNPDLPEDEQQITYCGREIFFSTNWSMIQRAQAEDRAHRRGTKMPVQITDLVCPNTIDETIRHRVTSKVENATRLQDISNILNEVLHINLDLGAIV